MLFTHTSFRSFVFTIFPITKVLSWIKGAHNCTYDAQKEVFKSIPPGPAMYEARRCALAWIRQNIRIVMAEHKKAIESGTMNPNIHMIPIFDRTFAPGSSPAEYRHMPAVLAHLFTSAGVPADLIMTGHRGSEENPIRVQVLFDFRTAERLGLGA